MAADSETELIVAKTKYVRLGVDTVRTYIYVLRTRKNVCQSVKTNIQICNFDKALVLRVLRNERTQLYGPARRQKQ